MANVANVMMVNAKTERPPGKAGKFLGTEGKLEKCAKFAVTVREA